MRKLLNLMALFVLTLLSVSLVSANSLDDGTLSLVEVEINDQEATIYTQDKISNDLVDDLDAVAVDEGGTLNIEAFLEATQTHKDVQVEAEIRGYEYDDYESLADRTHVFDMQVPVTSDENGTTTKKKILNIDLPKKLDKDRYLLRLTVDDKDSASLVRYVVLQIEPARHGVDIADVAFSPGNTVKAGRALLATVLLENYGDKTERDVKVTVAIPELGVTATEFVDKVEHDGDHNIDYKDVAEMFLPIPGTAAEGEYAVKVTVSYDDLRETISKTYLVNVVADERFQPLGKLVLEVGPEKQSIAPGKTATYVIALINAGQTSKAYTLEAVTGDWATASVSDPLVVLGAGQNKIVYVDVAAAADAPEGDYVASVAVKSGSEVLETISLQASVAPGESVPAKKFSLRNGLEIALIVLVVLLVIVGLIIGFSRLRKNEEEEQTVY